MASIVGEEHPAGAPSLTVCICVRDGADHVERCLRALVAETAADHLPIVLVDHASSDRTPELLARCVASHPDRVRVLRFDGDGLGAVRDFAWRSTTTPWLAFVDIDCEVQAGWGAAVLHGVRRHAAGGCCGAFGGSTRVPAGRGWLADACAIFLPTFIGGHGSILNRAVTEIRQVDHCPTLNVVYRREALERIGGFDPAYTRLAEDVDVSRRLVVAGFTLWTNPAMAIEHAPRPSLRQWLRNMYLYGRGRCFFLKRHPNAFQAKFLLPVCVAIVYLLALMIDLAARRIAFPTLMLLSVAHVTTIAVVLAAETRRQGSRWAVWLRATLVLWLTHLSYGLGMLRELPRRRDRFVL